MYSNEISMIRGVQIDETYFASMAETNIIYERYCFYQRCQKSEETLKEFVNDVIKLAETCEFKDYIEPIVRDRVIFGLHNENIKAEIIQKGGNPSLNETIEFCEILETNSRGSDFDDENGNDYIYSIVLVCDLRKEINMYILSYSKLNAFTLN